MNSFLRLCKLLTYSLGDDGDPSLKFVSQVDLFSFSNLILFSNLNCSQVEIVLESCDVKKQFASSTVVSQRFSAETRKRWRIRMWSRLKML